MGLKEFLEWLCAQEADITDGVLKMPFRGDVISLDLLGRGNDLVGRLVARLTSADVALAGWRVRRLFRGPSFGLEVHTLGGVPKVVAAKPAGSADELPGCLDAVLALAAVRRGRSAPPGTGG